MRKSVQILTHLEKEFANYGFSQTDADNIERYLEYLVKWNQKINLSGYKNCENLFGKLILDSLMVYKISDSVPAIKQMLSGKTIDLGSGAGIPGLVLALCNSTMDIDSIDSSQKKITFQKMVQANLGLKNIHPLNKRIEDLKLNPSYQHSYDCILSRALAQIKMLFDFSNYFLCSGGHLFLWKGEKWRDELNEAAQFAEIFELQKVLSYNLDEYNHRGVLLHYRKN